MGCSRGQNRQLCLTASFAYLSIQSLLCSVFFVCIFCLFAVNLFLVAVNFQTLPGLQ